MDDGTAYVGVAPRTFGRDRAALLEGAAVFTATAGAVFAIAAANGGYFAASWGWSTLFFAWAAATAFALRSHLPRSRATSAFVGVFAAFAIWTLVSFVWATSGAPVFEAERTLVYVLAAAAVLAAVNERTIPLLLGGVLAGSTAVSAYALATRLLPDRFGTFDAVSDNRLEAPIGYWNGLGIVVVLATVLALGLSARARATAGRALAAATLPILLPTLYFTFSRGSWLALGLALVVLLAVDARRLQLIAAAVPALVPAGIALALAWNADALGRKGGTLAAAASAGRPLARDVALLALAAALVSLATTAIALRTTPSERIRRVVGAALLLLALAGVGLALARVGGPVHAARRAWHSFTSPPIRVETGGQERSRLFSLSNDNRTNLWRAAWREGKAHPLVGGGAGSYEAWWLQHRPTAQKVRDAHSLYLQTFGELGLVGLGLLLVALLVPVGSGLRMRRSPLVPAALAAYVAYLFHAAGDWDWQLAGVTVPAVLIGASLVAATRDDDGPAARRAIRPAAAAAGCAVGVLSVFIVLGNVPLTRAGSAADEANWAQSAREARQAIRWLPWSSEPWRLLGEAELAQRRRAAAAVDLRKAISTDSGNWQLWFDLAAATDGGTAKHALARAHRLDPLSPEIAQFGL